MRRVQTAALVATALVALVFAVRGVGKALRPDGNDFTIYYEAGRAMLEGRDPLEVSRFVYPPAAALVFAPFALLPYAAAAVLWQLVSFAALVLAAREAARWAAGAGRAPGASARAGPTVLLWAPTACVLRLVDSNFANGQVNVVTLLLVVVALRAHGRGRDGLAGSILGAAAAVKVLPGIFAVYFLARRSWKALGALVASAALCLVILPAPFLGFTRNLASLEAWWRANPGPYLTGGSTLLEARPYLPGQSLPAALYRALTPTPATSSPGSDVRANVCDLDPDVVKWIVRAVGLGLVALLVAFLASRRAWGVGPADPRDGALTIATALLVAPLVHKGHMVWALAPCAVILGCLLAPPRRGPRVWAAAVLLGLFVLLVQGTAPGFLGRGAATGLLTRNVITLGLLVLFAAILAAPDAARPSAPLSGDARAGILRGGGSPE